MSDRRQLYESSEPWDKDIPADLIPAIKHLTRKFSDIHWGCGQTTEKFCYALLHNEALEDPKKEYFHYFMAMKVRVGTASAAEFNALITQATAPAIFKAFFDLYLNGVAVEALLIFKDLVEIGRANESRLGVPHLEWAETQTKRLIRSQNHLLRAWVKDACDRHIYDPEESVEDLVYRKNWRAPMLLLMQPSLKRPYDPETVWERKDPEESSKLVEYFVELYVRHLERKLRKAAGDAALELAKQPPPIPLNRPSEEFFRAPMPVVQGTSPNSARREARKLNTQAMYKTWQKEFRRLQKDRPDMSAVWYSQQIAKLAIAKGSSAETIRKHMKR